MAIVRTEEEIREVIDRARALTDAAEADGGSDHVADAVYESLRWVVGDDDRHPNESVLEDTEGVLGEDDGTPAGSKAR